jgi:4-amino-4-deoxy-L-arabinose transferase-like glycosyltransferase
MTPKRAAGWIALAGPLAAGLLARLALIAWSTPLVLSLDESRFWDLASTNMSGTAFLPPLYPFYLAAVRALCGDSVLAARIVGAVLSLVSILLVYRLAERHTGPGTGLVPAWAAALLPTLVYFDGRLRSESMTAGLCLGLAVLWSAPSPRDSRSFLWAGLLAGLLALTRPEFLLLPLALVALHLRRGGSGPAARKGLLLLPGLLLTVVPWAARNHALLGTTALATNGGYNFYKSFNPQSDGSQIPVTDLSVFDGVAEKDFDATGFRAGWEFIATHPLRSVALSAAKWVHLFGPERDLLSDLRQGHLPRRSLPLVLVLAGLQNLAWGALLAAGLFSLIGPSRTEVKEAILATLLTLLTVHLVMFGDDRFHVPLLPLLCVALPEAWDGSVRTPRALRLLGIALVVEMAGWGLILVRDFGRIGALFDG